MRKGLLSLFKKSYNSNINNILIFNFIVLFIHLFKNKKQLIIYNLNLIT